MLLVGAIIRPVRTGMNLKKKLFVSVGEDPPRAYGDEPDRTLRIGLT